MNRLFIICLCLLSVQPRSHSKEKSKWQRLVERVNQIIPAIPGIPPIAAQVVTTIALPHIPSKTSLLEILAPHPGPLQLPGVPPVPTIPLPDIKVPLTSLPHLLPPSLSLITNIVIIRPDAPPLPPAIQKTLNTLIAESLKDIIVAATKLGVPMSSLEANAIATIRLARSLPIPNDSPLPGWLAKHAQDGDLIVGSHPLLNKDLGQWAHIGLVSNSEGETIIESMPDARTWDGKLISKRGVQEVSWEYFAKQYARIECLRIKHLDRERLSRIISWARSKKGAIWEDPLPGGALENESSFYCSKLVYLATKRETQLDLRESRLLLPGLPELVNVVSPDNIYNSRHVDVVAVAK